MNWMEKSKILNWSKKFNFSSYFSILASIGCTSIVAEDRKGRIIHGRNLDYAMTSLIRNLTVIVDFTQGGNVRLHLHKTLFLNYPNSFQ